MFDLMTKMYTEMQEINSKVGALESETQNIKGEIAIIKSSMVTKEDLGRVERDLKEDIKSLDAKIDNRFDSLSKDVAQLLSNDMSEVISSKLSSLQTEVGIIKSSVGEHEMDIKYLKKVK
jgi:prefoldin subunit 5